MLEMFSVAVVQTKVISRNSANKSGLLQVVHAKAIAALTQFCDFFHSIVNSDVMCAELRLDFIIFPTFMGWG